jgi:P-type Cu+ transporter
MDTTSFLLSNLHCPSCVSTIEDALNSLRPRPSLVSSSIISSWVTVHHEQSLSSGMIRNALEDVGFEVRSTVSNDMKQRTQDTEIEECVGNSLSPGEKGLLDRTIEQWWSGLKGKHNSIRYMTMSRRHLELCALCQADAAKGADEKQPSSFCPIVPRTELEHAMPQNTEMDMEPYNGRASSVYSRNENANDADFEKPELPSFVVVDKGSTDDLWQASLALGGLTCVACVNAIKEELEQMDWIKRVDINLIMSNATVEFVGKDHSKDIVDIIESIGYEAVLNTLVQSQVGPPPALQTRGGYHEETQLSPRRTVEIKMAGMYCSSCPERVLRFMDTFMDRGLTVDKPLSIAQPILKFTYTPQAPEFTIRQIFSGLAEVDRALVPSIYHRPTLEELSQLLYAKERWSILKRVILCIIAAIPTFIIGIVYMSLVPSTDATQQFLNAPLSAGSPWTAGVSRAQWALFITATPVYFFAADVFHRRALKEICSTWRRGSKVPVLQRFYRFGSMDMLISLGTSIAYISSVAQLIVAGPQPLEITNANAFYFDSVVFLTLFLLVGRLIEAYSKARTGDAVALLGKLRPGTAILADKTNDSGRKVDVDLLDFGDIVRVMHGASPPNDGIVVEGDAAFDESSLTGESRLVKKLLGDQVYSGTINKGGPILIRVTGVEGTSMIDQIIKVVRDGQTRHAPIERIADILTSYFVPVITLMAICTWIIWLGLGLSGSLPSSYLDINTGGWAAWSLQFAIAVFIVACPCGLGLAAPTALFVGSGLAAKYGILVKGGGEAFEKASRLDCIVFDKTGTLTVGGQPFVTNYRFFPWVVKGLSTVEEKDILAMVKQLEENSSHPIADAIDLFCESSEFEGWEIKETTEIAGKGMKALFKSVGREEVEMIVGNEALLYDQDVEPIPAISALLRSWKREGKSVALVAVSSVSVIRSWHIAALFGISDDIRPEALSVVRALQQRGTAVWMLSGDNYDSACAVGAQVGIAKENVIAGVLPSEKADKIKYLQMSLGARNGKGKEMTQRRALVAMVGDGINDSPALTAADVGIAIGSGSDIAISSAEFILVRSNLNALITLLDLSNMVFNRIKFNFGWALVYNLIGVPVAAGVLYPIVSNGSHVRLDPVWASLAMALSSISVVCSSLALRSGIPGIGFIGRKW